MSNINMGEIIALNRTLSGGNGDTSKIKYVEFIDGFDWFLNNVPIVESPISPPTVLNVGLGYLLGMPYLDKNNRSKNDEEEEYDFSGIIEVRRFHYEEWDYDEIHLYDHTTLNEVWSDNTDGEYWLSVSPMESWTAENHANWVNNSMMTTIGGKITNTLDSGTTIAKFGNKEIKAPPAGVTSVCGKTGAVSLTYSDVGAQRPVTAGTGINITPEGVISLVFEDIHGKEF